MTHEESWQQNFELLTAYIEEHHHLPDKKKVENRGLLSWRNIRESELRQELWMKKRRECFWN